MRRKTGVIVVLLLIAVAFTGASIANAAKPNRSPLLGDPIVHGFDVQTGQDVPETHVCAFPVETSQPDGNYALTEFSETRLHITGSGHDSAKNLSNGKSVTLPTSGKLEQTVVANGNFRIRASGRTLFYFYPGDVGPFGPVGANGGLFYIVGQADEILSADYFVTSFAWSGRATELCSLIN